MQPDQIVIAPIVTEKAISSRMFSRYVFKVHPRATKIDIASAVEKLFRVKVKNVNTCKVRSKFKMRGRTIGRIPGWKKAYVTLSAGSKIEELEM
jgi:large subunit ribosomal protein L23